MNLDPAGATRQFGIPAGALETVLARFASETGILLATTAELVRGRTSPGVSGTYSVVAALDVLLRGTGLEAVRESQERVEQLVTDFYQKLTPMIERVERDGPMSLLGGMFGRGR